MSPFQRLLSYVLKYRRDFLLGLGCVVVTRGVAVTGPWVLGYAIDDLKRDVTRTKLVEYGALLLAIGVVSGVFLFLQRRLLTGASRHIEYDMRNDFFAHLQTLPVAFFQGHRTGDLMSRATNDLNAVRMMVGPSVMYSVSTLLTLVVALTLMVSIDLRLSLLALVPLPFASFSVKYFGSAIHTRFEQIQAQLSELSAVAQEALSGVRVVRAYGQEAAEIERFRRSNAEYLRRNRRLIAVQGFFFPSMSFFLGLGALLVLWLGSREVIRGRITLGQFVAFNSYLTMLSWPMIAFGWVTNMLQRGMASWKRMLEVLETPPAIADTVRLTASSKATAVRRSFTRRRKPDTTETVRLKPDTTETVRLKPDTTETVRLKPDTTETVRLKPDTTETVRLKPDTTEAVRLKPDTTEAVRLKPDTTEAVRLKAEAVRLKADATYEQHRTSYKQRHTSVGSDLRQGVPVVSGLSRTSEDVAFGLSRTSAIRGAIEFRDLVFGYNGTPVLNHVSARIDAGQTVALVGVTGSGKSTLINLLARVHDPPPQSVFVDGVDVREIPLAVLRGAIGCVPQEPFLFSDTLADNVAFGLDAIDGAGGARRAGEAGGEDGGAGRAGDAGRAGEAGDRMQRIIDAAAVARLDKDIADFPNGYDTMVGERGITLSGGQKQRTAIARAIVIDPAILILDDALSAVDTYTEEEILARLGGLMRERTSIIVSHRVSTVRDADQIFVLDEGTIVERGTHEELIRQNGLYAELHKKQLLEEELAAS